jgi:hypothetical protein
MRKLWNDPVWSKVIAGVILAVSLTAVSYLANQGLVIDPFLTRVFAFTSSPTPIPNWLSGIFLLVLAVALVRNMSPHATWDRS